MSLQPAYVDIHTPFRHFELACYASDVPLANAAPSGTRKIVQTLSNTWFVISMSKVAVVLFCKTDAPQHPDHYSSLEGPIRWCETTHYLGRPMTVYLVDYHGSDRKVGDPETGHARTSTNMRRGLQWVFCFVSSPSVPRANKRAVSVGLVPKLYQEAAGDANQRPSHCN